MRIPLNDDFHFWTASEFLCRDFTIEKEEDVTGGGLLPRRAKAIIGGVSKNWKVSFMSRVSAFPYFWEAISHSISNPEIF